MQTFHTPPYIKEQPVLQCCREYHGDFRRQDFCSRPKWSRRIFSERVLCGLCVLLRLQTVARRSFVLQSSAMSAGRLDEQALKPNERLFAWAFGISIAIHILLYGGFH